MPNQFSIYNSKKDRNFPKAVDELKVEITLKDEGTSLFGLLNSGKVFGTVVGYLSKEFEYNATGNYTNVFDVKSNNTLIGKIIEDEVQGNIANYGYLTKKMYHNGDSPTIDISFRCYAGAGAETDTYNTLPQQGIVNPVQIANVLINATLPRVGKKGVLNFTSLHGIAESETPQGKIAANILPSKNGITANSTVGEISNSALKSLVNIYDAVTNINFSDLVSHKPPVCDVKVGNIFEKSMMVVKTVSVKFSKEFMSEGVPLYADFDVSFQSLFNSSTLENGTDSNVEKIFGSGLNGANGRNTRVSFDYDKPVEQPIPVQKNVANQNVTMNRTAGPGDLAQISPGSRSTRRLPK